MSAPKALVLPRTSQAAFHQLLVASRQTTSIDALSAALKLTDPNALKQQLSVYVPVDVQQILAASGS